MPITQLKDINPRGRNWTICTRVSRMWEYRGGTDDGEIRHIDLVLIDSEGTSIYAEIGYDNIKAKAAEFTEGKIYTLERFRVIKSKPSYRPVESEYMIDITCHTLVKEETNVAPTFPLYAYKLTRFHELSSLVGETKYFIDVIGLITEISDVSTIHLQTQSKPTTRRTITLRDESNYEIKLYIWGKRACEFNVAAVCANNDQDPVIGLFVGTLVKTYKGEHALSGNAACRWYINPDIPETYNLLNSLQGEFQPVQQTKEAEEETASQPTYADPTLKTLEEMMAISPYEFPPQGFRCIVTVTKINSQISWWFWSCNRCSKSCLPEGTGYKCPHCSCTGAKMKYKICLFATDGTDEAEFIFFGEMGRRLVRKDVRLLLNSIRKPDDMPSDLAALVSQKYEFTVNVTKKSFAKAQRSYEVKSINSAYGRQPTIPTIKKTSSVAAPLKLKDFDTSEQSSSTESNSDFSKAQDPTNTPAYETIDKRKLPYSSPDAEPSTKKVRRRLTSDEIEPSDPRGNESST